MGGVSVKKKTDSRFDIKTLCCNVWSHVNQKTPAWKPSVTASEPFLVEQSVPSLGSIYWLPLGSDARGGSIAAPNRSAVVFAHNLLR